MNVNNGGLMKKISRCCFESHFLRSLNQHQLRFVGWADKFAYWNVLWSIMERHSGRKAQRDSKLRWTDCSGLEVDRLLAAASWSHSALSVGENRSAALATSLAMLHFGLPWNFCSNLGWTPGGQRGGMSIHHSFHVIWPWRIWGQAYLIRSDRVSWAVIVAGLYIHFSLGFC